LGQRKLDGLLRDWAASIIAEIESSSLPSKTVIAKIMENGCRVDSGVVPIPNYWPRPDLVKINDIIWSMKVPDRNIIVMKRVLGYSYSQIAQEFDKSKGWAFYKMNEIERIIRINLTN
jgi:hypothetical protein